MDVSLQTRDITLLEVLDRLIDKGIVLQGDLIISLADVDLIYVGVRLILTSADTVQRTRKGG
ncbi:MAG: gas vesicle protein [Dethiobacter sp.]|jgi:hypothetical protein|nr:MAG: gas vesicle protein [Dethiobacter sp.]